MRRAGTGPLPTFDPAREEHVGAVAVTDAKDAAAPREQVARVGDGRRVLLARGNTHDLVRGETGDARRQLAREAVPKTELACGSRGSASWTRLCARRRGSSERVADHETGEGHRTGLYR